MHEDDEGKRWVKSACMLQLVLGLAWGQPQAQVCGGSERSCAVDQPAVATLPGGNRHALEA